MRPHFAYSTPKGYTDERAIYPFDKRNVAANPPFSTITLLPGQTLLNQILRLDADAEFRWRGISWEYPNSVELATFTDGPLAIRLRGPYDRYLSNDFIPLFNCAQGYYVIMSPWSGSVPPASPQFEGPYCGGMGVAFADEIICPASSIIQIDLLSLQINACALGIGGFMARGVKRRPVGDCATEAR
jgi:hypothetical protein